MIKKRTVFILGAGASVPYGFPTGQRLYHEICSGLDNGELQEVLEKHHYDKSNIARFQDALYRSGVNSVDAFLETRPEYISMGKLAIATALVKYEIEDNLFSEGSGKWYKYLFSRLGNKIEDLPRNNLTIITYNYDRSLEHFLITAIKNKYKLDDQNVLKIMTVLPIIHLHGKLGGLPGQTGFTRAYKNDFLHPSEISKTAESIRIVHESVTGDENFDTARSYLSDAENIFCLGFGYYQLNLDRLHISRLSQGSVKGTTLGLTRAEITTLVNENNGVLNLGESNNDVIGFLRSTEWE